jgi:hypothetical protein
MVVTEEMWSITEIIIPRPCTFVNSPRRQMPRTHDTARFDMPRLQYHYDLLTIVRIISMFRGENAPETGA